MSAALKTLIRLRRWEVDEKRRLLGAAMREADAAYADRDGLAQAFAGEKARAAAPETPPWSGFAAYARAVIDRLGALDGLIEQREEAVAEARSVLADAYLDLRSLELIAEQRAAEEAALRAAREDAERDELTLLRRGRDGDSRS